MMAPGGSACFQYRLPRYPYRFRLELIVDGTSVGAHCLNLSETGLLAQLEHPVAAEGPVSLRLVLPTWTVDLEVRIASTHGCRYGFRFLFPSEQQFEVVRALLATCR